MINQSPNPLDYAVLVVNDSGVIGWAFDPADLVGLKGTKYTGRRLSDFMAPLSGFATAPDTTPVVGQFRSRNGRLIEVSAQSLSSPAGPAAVPIIWLVRPAGTQLESRDPLLSCDTAAKSFHEDGFDGRFTLSTDGQIVSGTSYFSEIYGYAAFEQFTATVGGNMRKLYVDPQRHDELMRQLRQSGSVTRFESAVYRRDGTTTWVSESVRAVFDADGRVQHYIGTVQDIGWRKLAEEILNQAEEKWRAVVESSGECIVIADRSGTVFFANTKAQQSGIGVPGGNVFREFSTPSQHNLRAAIDLTFQSMRAEVIDLERIVPGSERAWYEVRVVPIGNADSVARVILIATDLTGRKRAEEAVREGQRLIGRVADASPAILYVYDFTSEQYVYVNHQVEKILGYTNEAFLARGKSMSDSLVHKDDAGLLVERRRLLSEARDDGVVFEYTFRMRHAGGQWIWIRARDVVFTRGPDGRPAQILGMAEDVTERRRAGQERERSREQLRALSARLQDAREEERAAISRRVHDELGQALTALSWELSKLADQLNGPSDRQPEINARLTGMTGMVDSMMQIVRKVSAELRPPILDHFGLVAAVEWQAKEFQERYRITCEVAARGRGTIRDRAISTAVFRIFQEILTNVARHSGATKVRVQFSDNSRGLALIVHDNGRGITEGQKSQSLGILGMRERAHLFGGSIEIEGAPGRGTTVTVHIPNSPETTWSSPRKETLRRPR